MLEAEQSSKLADVGKAASGGAGAADVGANALARADASVGSRGGAATEDMKTALPEAAKQAEEEAAAACTNYRVDLVGATFGVCKCGLAKAEHGPQLPGKEAPRSAPTPEQGRS
jgi:hypothetical protein